MGRGDGGEGRKRNKIYFYIQVSADLEVGKPLGAVRAPRFRTHVASLTPRGEERSVLGCIESYESENRRIFQLVRDLQSLKKRQNSCYRGKLRARALSDIIIRKAYAHKEF